MRARLVIVVLAVSAIACASSPARVIVAGVPEEAVRVVIERYRGGCDAGTLDGSQTVSREGGVAGENVPLDEGPWGLRAVAVDPRCRAVAASSCLDVDVPFESGSSIRLEVARISPEPYAGCEPLTLEPMRSLRVDDLLPAGQRPVGVTFCDLDRDGSDELVFASVGSAASTNGTELRARRFDGSGWADGGTVSEPIYSAGPSLECFEVGTTTWLVAGATAGPTVAGAPAPTPGVWLRHTASAPLPLAPLAPDLGVCRPPNWPQNFGAQFFVGNFAPGDAAEVALASRTLSIFDLSGDTPRCVESVDGSHFITAALFEDREGAPLLFAGTSEGVGGDTVFERRFEEWRELETMFPMRGNSPAVASVDIDRDGRLDVVSAGAMHLRLHRSDRPLVDVQVRGCVESIAVLSYDPPTLLLAVSSGCGALDPQEMMGLLEARWDGERLVVAPVEVDRTEIDARFAVDVAVGFVNGCTVVAWAVEGGIAFHRDAGCD